MTVTLLFPFRTTMCNMPHKKGSLSPVIDSNMTVLNLIVWIESMKLIMSFHEAHAWPVYYEVMSIKENVFKLQEKITNSKLTIYNLECSHKLQTLPA